MKSLKTLPIAIFAICFMVSACSKDNEMGKQNMQAEEDTAMNASSSNNQQMRDVTSAIAVIHPTQGNQASGWVSFSSSSQGVQVNGEFSNLPQGKHGVHVHLYGDCSASDGTSAGTHFNFEGSSKNPPEGIDRITGNLGNADAGTNGGASIDTTIANTSLSAILGRSVVVHAKPNDPSQPPIGAAGSRLGCGVIGIANPDTDM